MTNPSRSSSRPTPRTWPALIAWITTCTWPELIKILIILAGAAAMILVIHLAGWL